MTRSKMVAARYVFDGLDESFRRDLRLNDNVPGKTEAEKVRNFLQKYEDAFLICAGQLRSIREHDDGRK